MGAEISVEGIQYVEHSSLGKVILDLSLRNQFHCVTIQMVRSLPSFVLVQKWLKDDLQKVVPQLIIKQKQKGRCDINFGPNGRLADEKYSALLLPVKYSWQEEGICGSEGIFKVQYQAFMFNMQTEIINRNSEGIYFLQTEIWFILFTLIELASMFHERNLKIGNMHPKNILINEDGQIKVVGKHCVFQYDLDNYQEKVINLYAKSFLAPEQVKQINYRQDTYPRSLSPFRAQIFSIGMTLLCAATLTTGQEFYSIQENSNCLEINFTQIGSKMKSLKQHYSSFLYSIISIMLEQKPYLRRQSIQIYKDLKPYEADIMQLHPFLPDFSHSKNNVTRQQTIQYDNKMYDYSQIDEIQQKRRIQQRKLNSYYKILNKY